MRFGHLAERVELGFVLGLAEAAQRAPAHEVQTDFRRVFQRIGGVEVDRRVLVLHGDELVAEDAARDVDLLDGSVGDAGLLRHALVHQLLDGFDGLVVRHLRIGAVEVQQVNGVHAERQCALLATTNQVLRATVHIPRGAAVGEVAEMTDLGGDGDLVLRAVPRGHGLADQLFAGLLLLTGGVIRPRGVDMTAASIQRCMQGLDTDIVAPVVFNG